MKVCLCSTYVLFGESSYYIMIDSLAQVKADQKMIYNIYNDLLGRDKYLPVPPHESNEMLANRFNTYFSDKISKIHKDLESTLDTSICNPFIYDVDCTTELRKFNQLSSTQVKKILMASPSKSCRNDPIPTTLLKEILSSVIDFIMAIVSQSL